MPAKVTSVKNPKDEIVVSDEWIVTQYKNQEPCRHGSRFWCEDCVNDTYKLHTVIAKQEAYESVARRMGIEAGAAYVEDKHDIAVRLKALAKDYKQLALEREEEADKIRREQGIIK